MLIAVDTETTGLDLFGGDCPFAISTCDETGATRFWEWDVDPKTRQVMPPSEEIAEFTDYIDGNTLVFHNIKFDLRALSNLGIRIHFKQVDPIREQEWKTLPYCDHKYEAVCETFEDTLLAAHVCDSVESHGLKPLSEKYLDILVDDEEELLEAVRASRRAAKSKKNWNLAPNVKGDYWLPKAIDSSSTVLKKYAVQDAVRTMLLWHMYSGVMEREKFTPQYRTRKALTPITYRMETTGVTVKKVLLGREIKRYEDAALVEEAKCIQLVESRDYLDEEFNIRSGKQIQKVLYGDPEGTSSLRKRGLNCPIIQFTESGQLSTSADVLLELYEGHVRPRSKAKEFVANILRYRKNKTCAQYLESYKQGLQREGKRTLLHPSFNQTGTRTTRWSSSNPNGQNIGSGGKDAFGNEVDDFCLRDVFGPSAGRVWLSIDYSQLELRILSVLAQEHKLLEAFEGDGDIHSLTADLCGISRKAAKGVNYGIIYGAGQEKLEAMTGLENFNEVFSKAYPRVSEFMSETTRKVKKDGYVKTIGGYRLTVPRDKPYIGTNYIIQGSAGDILNRAMIQVDNYLKFNDDFPDNNDGYLIMCIHDELVFDFDRKSLGDAPQKIRQLMEEAGIDLGVKTPVDVERIDQKWSKGRVLK